MTDLLQGLFSTEGYHPHGFCYLWQPGLVWLHLIADSLIGLAYIAIGLSLAHFVRQGRGEKLPFSGMFVAFGIFIAACGGTHFMSIWTLWSPVYWLAGSVKVVTAVASVFTALALPPLIPVALATLASARLSERRRVGLEDAHLKLKEMDQLKTQFFANVSHELRTPLTLILGPVDQLLKEAELTDSQRQKLQTIERNAAVLLHHVNDLLEVARLEAGRMELSYQRVDLARLVRLSAANFESMATTVDSALTVDVPDAVYAEVDPDKIRRVMFNLLGNAIKFTPAGGEIHCSLEMLTDPEKLTEIARIAVQDSGPGVRVDQRMLIFEPFRQSDGGPDRKTPGTGLGLAIVADLVKLHGGEVWVEDSPIGGASFVVEIPLHAPRGTTIRQESPTPASEDRPDVKHLAPQPVQGGRLDPTIARGALGRPVVLVVEDNVDMNRFVSESLSRGYQVVQAFNGREGVKLANEMEPDLVISDIMMPDVTGEGLVQELRQNHRLASVPIVLLSARADDEVRLRLLREGAQDYITKPFSTDELRARVANLIGMKRAKDILQRELDTSMQDVEVLADVIATRKRELETALLAAREAFAAADAANRAKSDFLGIMSHELRTPLNAIFGYIDLLEMDIAGPLTEKQRGYAGRVRKSADHLLALVEEVLTFARLEAGAEQAEPSIVDLREVVADAASFVENSAADKDLVFDIQVPDVPVGLTTDAAKVRRILLNLLSNAIKFTDTGTVSVILTSDGPSVVVRVRDTGPGIPEGQRENIFEPFWQADTSMTRRAGGAGLGLSIARGLARLLGGELRLEDSGGDGAHFVVTLHSIGAGTSSSGSPVDRRDS